MIGLWGTFTQVDHLKDPPLRYNTERRTARRSELAL